MTLPNYDKALTDSAAETDGYRCHYCEKTFYLFGVDIFQCGCGTFVCHNCTIDDGNKYCCDECLPEIE